MRLLISFVVILFLLPACDAPKESAHPLTEKLDSLFRSHSDFSGTVLIAEKGRPVYHSAFGYRDFENKIRSDTTTLFELASVTKQFTAMIIMMLKEDGKLNYNDPLEKFIPDLPYPGITIRNLLTHTSGLPDYQAVMDQHWDKSRVAGNEEIIQYLKQYHPEKRFNPGDQYEYSNTGYVLLATVAEAASGKDFVAMSRERIFVPLGMTSTNIRTLEEKAKVNNFARGYIFVPERLRYVPADSFPTANYIVWLGSRKGPGRVSSTTSDLLRWDRALYSETLIRKETLAEAFTPFRLNNDSLSYYGFGWRIENHPTLGQKIWHTGSNPGYATRIVRFIDEDKTIIVLSNNAYPKIKNLDAALDSLLGPPIKVAPHQRINE